jgi:hypothetical protein
LRQDDELARVKVRIKALTERTIERGCTEAEAIAAAEMVGRLLARYALTMDEVDIRQEPCVQVDVPIGGKQRRPIDAAVPAIARFCDCKVWLTRTDQGAASYVFFGFDTDAALWAASAGRSHCGRNISLRTVDFFMRHYCPDNARNLVYRYQGHQTDGMTLQKLPDSATDGAFPSTDAASRSLLCQREPTSATACPSKTCLAPLHLLQASAAGYRDQSQARSASLGCRAKLRMVQQVQVAHHPLRSPPRPPSRLHLPRVLAHLLTSLAGNILKGARNMPPASSLRRAGSGQGSSMRAGRLTDPP